MAKYMKKPVVVDAVPYEIGLEDGWEFYHIDGTYIGYMTREEFATMPYPKSARIPVIETLEGRMKIEHDDYIITGVEGERYPCKKRIFEKTYELVET
jgi:hypothetical protein